MANELNGPFILIYDPFLNVFIFGFSGGSAGTSASFSVDGEAALSFFSPDQIELTFNADGSEDVEFSSPEPVEVQIDGTSTNDWQLDFVYVSGFNIDGVATINFFYSDLRMGGSSTLSFVGAGGPAPTPFHVNGKCKIAWFLVDGQDLDGSGGTGDPVGDLNPDGTGVASPPRVKKSKGLMF